MAACGVTYDVARIARPIANAGLITLMVVGSLAVWTVIPITGLWVASQLSDSNVQMGAGPLLVAAGGIPAAMALVVALLARVERLRMRLTGTAPQARVVPTWRRSIGDSHSAQMTVLDRIMVASVVVAVIAMGIWFFAFAGSSLPN
jgi:membrane protein required for beta-lactamase induction